MSSEVNDEDAVATSDQESAGSDTSQHAEEYTTKFFPLGGNQRLFHKAEELYDEIDEFLTSSFKTVGVHFDFQAVLIIFLFMVVTTCLCSWFDRWVTENRDIRRASMRSSMARSRTSGILPGGLPVRVLLHQPEMLRQKQEAGTSSQPDER